MQASGVEITPRLLDRKESGFAKCVGINGTVRRGGRNHLIDEVVDEGFLPRKLRRQRVRAEERRNEPRDVGVVAVMRDEVEQRRLARLVQRVAGLGFERRRAVRQDRLQARADDAAVELLFVEQRFAGAFDGVQHAELRLLAAQPRGEVGLAIAGKERVRVRVDKAGEDYAFVAHLGSVAAKRLRDFIGLTDGCDDTALDGNGAVVDASERSEINAALRSIRIAGNDRLGADDETFRLGHGRCIRRREASALLFSI